MRELLEYAGVSIIIVGIIVIISFALVHSFDDTPRLVNECIQDGHKEYECRAMFRRCGK